MSDFIVDISIVGNEVGKFVLVNDFLGNIVEVHAHVIKSIKGGVQIHVGYFKEKVTSVLGGEHWVPLDLMVSRLEVSVLMVPGEVSDKVFTSGDSGSVRFIFFRTDG